MFSFYEAAAKEEHIVFGAGDSVPECGGPGSTSPKYAAAEEAIEEIDAEEDEWSEDLNQAAIDESRPCIQKINKKSVRSLRIFSM